MALINRYIDEFSTTTSVGEDEVESGLVRIAAALPVGENELLILRKPPLYDPFGARGSVRVRINKEHTPGQTRLFFRIRPLLFNVSNAIWFLLVAGVFWGLMAWIKPADTYVIAAAILFWLITSFVAFYWTIILLTIVTVVLLFNSIDNIPYILVAWIVTAILAHLALSYNRSELNRYTRSLLNRLELNATSKT
ncbi:MAG: hypothetical protein JWQ27_3320 [Ferruginibacter sp.]|nr:hypothetical protein [Ferruginibacter sp.]